MLLATWLVRGLMAERLLAQLLACLRQARLRFQMKTAVVAVFVK
jgi:hypothetical protein